MTNRRTLIDVNLTKSVALPAAGATAYTPFIDLLTVTAGRVPCVELFISTSAALATLADTKNVTFTVQDSADGANGIAAAADLPVYTSTGAGGAGAAAVDVQVKLPINLRRFVRLAVTADAAAGNLAAITATVGLAF